MHLQNIPANFYPSMAKPALSPPEFGTLKLPKLNLFGNSEGKKPLTKEEIAEELNRSKALFDQIRIKGLYSTGLLFTADAYHLIPKTPLKTKA